MKKILLGLLMFFIPYFALANTISFNEIMYDAEGSDTNKEYVEIKNSTANSINLEGYKFCEGGSCHGLYDGYGNDFNFSAGSFGIFVKNPDEFRIAYPNFSGFILKSSFSLKNSEGELLELKDTGEIILDSLTYDPTVGGTAGDTLSIFNNVWKNGEATPGEENVEKGGGSGDNGGSDDSDDDSNQSSNSSSSTGDGELRIEIDEIKTIITKVKFNINARAFNSAGKELHGIDFLWSFGDGSEGRSRKINHIYYFSGEYLISLTVKANNYESVTIIRKVKVMDSPIQIFSVDFEQKFIELKSIYGSNLNLAGWIIMVGDKKFVIPENTYILKNGTIKFTQRNTGLQIKPENEIFLLYPGGKKFQKWETEKVVEEMEEVVVIVEDKSTVVKNNSTTKKIDINTTTIKKTNFVSSKKPAVEESKNLTEKTKPNVAQAASILPLKNEKDSFVKDNLIEILFFGFLLFLIISLFYFRKKTPEDSIKKEADEFEILEK